MTPKRRKPVLRRLLRIVFGRKETKPKLPSLYPIRGGVYIREPNSSAHPIQNLIEQILTTRGMALFNLRSAQAETLLHNGEWQDDIASASINVAVAGRIVVKSIETDIEVSPAIQHVDTASGLRFDCLPHNNPNRRAPNSHYSHCFCPILEYNQYYFERDEEFLARKHIESHLEHGTVTYFTLDVRFYGPGGRIMGGFAETHNPEHCIDPITCLSSRMVAKLEEVLVLSLQAHQRSMAEIEAFGGLDKIPAD